MRLALIALIAEVCCLPFAAGWVSDVPAPLAWLAFAACLALYAVGLAVSAGRPAGATGWAGLRTAIRAWAPRGSGLPRGAA